MIISNRPEDEGLDPGICEAMNLNMARVIATAGSYQYLWVLESDIVPPPHAVEALAGPCVETGIYHYRRAGRPDLPAHLWSICAPANVQPSDYQERLDKGETVRLMPPGEAGYCCVMIPRWIFLEFPFVVSSGTDVDWYHTLHNHNIMVLCNGGVRCEHLERR
jgi:hypothetical protein